MVKSPERFDVFLVVLDPTMGTEIQKSRPCVVISPNEMNRHIQTVIIAPMTTAFHDYPSRVPIHFGGKDGQIVLDQIRTVDRCRLVKHLGVVDSSTASIVLDVLVEMFSP